MKLHEGVERVHKRISEDVQSGVKIVSEEIRKMTDQLPDTESKMDLLEVNTALLKDYMQCTCVHACMCVCAYMCERAYMYIGSQ